MTTGAHSGARRTVDGTGMKRERPMVIGFVAGAEKERARFSKPPPSATRPRLQRPKPLQFQYLRVKRRAADRAHSANTVDSRRHRRRNSRLGIFVARQGLPHEERCHDVCRYVKQRQPPSHKTGNMQFIAARGAHGDLFLCRHLTASIVEPCSRGAPIQS